MKRLFSWILACALILSLLPAGAAAEASEFQTRPEVSAVGDTVIVLRADGTVWTQGSNWNGELGYETEEQATKALAQVPGPEHIIGVYAGSGFCLALEEDGTLWGWGSNESGQLGSQAAEYNNSPAPIPLEEGLRFTKLAVGGKHVVALTEDGKVYAWGAAGPGLRGDANVPTEIEFRDEVVVTDIATSGSHTLALTEDGKVYAWGENGEGQLGTGNTQAANRPTLVASPLPEGYPQTTAVLTLGESASVLVNGGPEDESCYISVSGSSTEGYWQGNYTEFQSFKSYSSYTYNNLQFFTSGSTAGFLSEGRGVYFWLEDGASLKRLGIDPGPVVRAWEGAEYLMTEDGSLVKTVGESSYEPLANATGYEPLVYASSGEPFNLLQPEGYFRTEPKVVAGDGHTVALTANGTVWTWGVNDYGQLGDGTTADRPYAVRVAGLEHVVDISAGGDTTMAYTADGTLWAWGRNDRGQLGVGDRVDSSLPRQVQLEDGVWLTDLANGDSHSMALTTARSVYVWGDSTYGQSDTSYVGDEEYRAVPVQLSSMKNIGSISAGGNASIASTSLNTYNFLNPSYSYDDTEIYRWGNGVKARDPEEVTYGGVSRYCAGVATNGSQWFCFSSTQSSSSTVGCWGTNDYGQLGVGHTDMLSSPKSFFTSVYSKYILSPSGMFNMGLNEGVLYLWGADPLLDPSSGGELAAITKAVELLDGVTDAAAGLDHIAALKTDGTIWTRGSNDRGQLGNGGTDDLYSDFSADRPVVKANGRPLSLAYSDAPLYSLTVTPEGGRGEIQGSQTDDYAQGSAITVTVSANRGWIFSHWTAEGLELEDPASPTLSFAMPAGDVTLTAIFTRDLPGVTGGIFLEEVGTADPSAILIHTAEQLAAIGTEDYPLDGSYVLAGDLDLSGYENWIPIGDGDAPFTGTFDGQGHVISGMSITGAPDCVGLFGVVGGGGQVKNLGLEDVSIALTGEGWDYVYVGAVAGRLGDGVTEEEAREEGKAAMTNCYVTGSISADLTWCDVYLGGLVGRAVGEISACSNLASLAGGTDSAGTLYLGGIVGEVCAYHDPYYTSTCTVDRCVNGGELRPDPASHELWAGGIAGHLKLYAQITECFNNVDLWLAASEERGDVAWMGGIAGMSDGIITDCFNTGDVGADESAALHGEMCCGGIVGQVFSREEEAYTKADSLIARCYTTGRVVARAVGGLSSQHASAGGIIGGSALQFTTPSGAKEIQVRNCMVCAPEISAYETKGDYGRGSAGIVGAARDDLMDSMREPTFYLSGITTNDGAILNDSGSAYSQSANLDWFKNPNDSVPPGYTVQNARWSWDFQQVWTTDEAWNDGLPYLRFLGERFQVGGYENGTARVYSRMSATETLLCAAAYDTDGRMCSFRTVRTDLESGWNTVSIPLAQTGAEVRVFLLRDGNWKPLAPSLRQ